MYRVISLKKIFFAGKGGWAPWPQHRTATGHECMWLVVIIRCLYTVYGYSTVEEEEEEGKKRTKKNFH